MFPDEAEVYLFLGFAYNHQKDYQNALKTFDEGLTKDAEHVALHFYRGAALERLGEFDQAIAVFRRVIELRDDYADAYNYIGYMYAEKGIHLNEALELVQKALSFEPENGAFVDSLGWIYYQKGKLKEAIRELERAAALIDTDPTIHDHLGDAYNKSGDRKQAAEHYQKSLQIEFNEAVQKKLDAINEKKSVSGQSSNK